MKRGEITTVTNGNNRIIRDHYDQLCANRPVILEEMDKFFCTYNLPTLSYEESGNFNRPMTRKLNQ